MRELTFVEAADVVRSRPALSMFGACMGAIPCGGAFEIMHGALEAVLNTWRVYPMLVTLAACLAFSVRTVWVFGHAIFGEGWKAGFLVVSLEGLMAVMPKSHEWLSLIALAALIGINAVATACHIVSQRPKAEPASETAPLLGLNEPRTRSRVRSAVPT